MADKANKHPENVPGTFYVDDQCIDCDLCRTTAPGTFGQAEGGYSYVHTQPGDDDTVALAGQAKDECPVEAIGNDGP